MEFVLRAAVTSPGAVVALGVALLFGCAKLAGVDDDYVAANPVPSGGTSGSGGALGGGGEGGTFGSQGAAGVLGASGSGGTGGTAAGSAGSGGTGGTGGSTCMPGQKFCNGECTMPRPLVGCAMDSCNPCTDVPPENAHSVCRDSACSVECDDNFQPRDGKCVSTGSGGTAGTAGTTGTGGASGTAGASGSGGTTCVPQQCPGCIPHGPFGCCMSSTRCGCTWAPGAVCYPG